MLIVNRATALAVLELPDCVEAVARAFTLHGHGETLMPTRLHVESGDGVFHVTLGGIAPAGERGVFGIKSNGRFPGPDGQRVAGAILLQDARDGVPLALIDSMAVTLVRTAATTVVATRTLARPGSCRAAVIGAGRQATHQVGALAAALPLESLVVWDRTPARAESLVEHARSLGLSARVAISAADAAAASDVIVTVTSATAPVLRAGEVRAGSLVIAIGADGPGKQELEPLLLASSKVVVDVISHAATAGELAHALASKLMTAQDVHAELGEILAGTRPGRERDDETIVFDTTGNALQDVAAALVIVEAARRANLGYELALSD